MFDFVVGMMIGSLLTIVPLLVWDRLERSKVARTERAMRDLAWPTMQERPRGRA
jgi:hypothetical protein